MPKMKTNKSIKSRFKKTGTGKLVHSSPGRRHIMTKKTAKRKRQLSNPSVLDETAREKTYKTLMGVK